MHICVILLIKEQYLVVKDNTVAFLSILVTRENLERNSRGDRRTCEFKFLTSLIFFSWLLRQLQKLPTCFVSQLNGHAVEYRFTTLVHGNILIVDLFVDFSLFLYLQQSAYLFGLFKVFGVCLGHFLAQFVIVTRNIVVLLWKELEDHVALVWNQG